MADYAIGGPDPEHKPAQLHNLTMLDTGAGQGRKVTMMEVNSRQYWQGQCKPVI